MKKISILLLVAGIAVVLGLGLIYGQSVLKKEKLYTYGPYSCGSTTFSIDDRFDLNTLEGVATNRWVRVIINNKEQETVQIQNPDTVYDPLTPIIATQLPEAAIGDYDFLSIEGPLTGEDTLTDSERTAFIACFNTHAKELYAEIHATVLPDARNLSFDGIAR